MTYYTKENIMIEVNSVIGENICENDEGYIVPETSNWSLIIAHPTNVLIPIMGSIKEYKEWFKNEVKDLSDIRGLEYFDDMIDNDIRDPIILSYVNGKFFVWDGWHRLSAAIISGQKTIPVILGKKDLITH